MLGLGVLLTAAGAILTWAVDVDVPYVDDERLGSLLLLAGVTLLVVAAAVHAGRSHERTDAGTGLVLFAAGAILTWALEVDVPYIWDGGLGAIMMVGGLVTIAATVWMERQATRSRRVVVHR